jgi:hypothetical protein
MEFSQVELSRGAKKRESLSVCARNSVESGGNLEASWIGSQLQRALGVASRGFQAMPRSIAATVAQVLRSNRTLCVTRVMQASDAGPIVASFTRVRQPNICECPQTVEGNPKSIEIPAYRPVFRNWCLQASAPGLRLPRRTPQPCRAA